MSIDAVALFRPKSPAALRPYLDLDEESQESNGLYAEELDDGSVLVHTFQPYAAFEASPVEGRAWLAQFGADLPLVHDDARGLLFFPDTAEPSGRTYDAVVAEIASAGVWIPAEPLTAVEARAGEGTSLAEHGMSGLDMEGLPAFAQQIFGSMNLGAAGAPGDMASMIATLQKQVMGALGMQGDELDGEELDEEAFEPLVL